jgi:hypothetical protein
MALKAGGPRKRAARKAATGGARKKVAREEPTAAARARAREIAERIPFVHFPPSKRIEEWKDWGAFKSRTHQGASPASTDSFDVLRASHVFAYAGPCCFAAAGHHGDAAAYLYADVDRRIDGEASPFDSGALEGDDARLQPWARHSKEERWKFLQQHVHPFSSWRQEFERWLLHCYTDPGRYLESSADKYAAGVPDRTRPPELLEHNGVNGRTLYGEKYCADRRTWTWEARFKDPVPFEEIRLLHVTKDRFRVASLARRAQLFGKGRAPVIRPLPALEASPPPLALYLRSQEVLEELIKP